MCTFPVSLSSLALPVHLAYPLWGHNLIRWQHQRACPSPSDNTSRPLLHSLSPHPQAAAETLHGRPEQLPRRSICGSYLPTSSNCLSLINKRPCWSFFSTHFRSWHQAFSSVATERTKTKYSTASTVICIDAKRLCVCVLRAKCIRWSSPSAIYFTDSWLFLFLLAKKLGAVT